MMNLSPRAAALNLEPVRMTARTTSASPFGRLRWAAVILLVFSLVELVPACGAGSAADASPREIVRIWAKVINLGLASAAGLLILYALSFRRQRLEEAGSKWMLFLGVCVLPTPVMLLSAAVGLEQSKKVEFCMSCHVMQSFTQDLKDPASKTLAALHYQNRYIQREHCYRCHTDYGILGTMEAKKAGLGHVWKAATGSYKLPIAMAKPYNYSICLDCHADSAKFNQEAAHDGVVQETLTGKSKCLDCHDAPHPPPKP
jgi:nitrate/TMAO reductase-like tetraheme cytochrome c subunit